MSISGNELKKLIRQKIPALGHRDLSVKYNGSYNVDIKKVVPLSKVEEVAKEQESYSTCSATGEILQGGNTFVFVNYCRWNTTKDEVFIVPVDKSFEDAIVKSAAKLTAGCWLGEENWQARGHHLPAIVKEDNVELFADYTKEDVSSVIGLVSAQNKEFSNWLRKG